MSNPTIRTIHIGSFEDFVTQNKLGRFSSSPTLYRGQSHDWPLIPKIARGFDPDTDSMKKVLAREAWLLQEFMRQGVGIEAIPTLKCDVLSKAQHHGLPTRLLDWTQNAIAALWFAVGEDSGVKAPQPVVWRFETDEGDFDHHSNFLGSKRTIVFRPNHVTARIRAQAGWFTVHRLPLKGPVAFEKLKKYSARLTKFKITGRRAAIRKKLNDLGINRATIYPELSNLCSHLEWESEYVVSAFSDAQIEEFSRRFVGEDKTM